jgi:hypothetical protein
MTKRGGLMFDVGELSGKVETPAHLLLFSLSFLLIPFTIRIRDS